MCGVYSVVIVGFVGVVFFKKKTAYELRISDWSSDVCSSDLRAVRGVVEGVLSDIGARGDAAVRELSVRFDGWDRDDYRLSDREKQDCLEQLSGQALKDIEFAQAQIRSEEQTSELQSLMRTS